MAVVLAQRTCTLCCCTNNFSFDNFEVSKFDGGPEHFCAFRILNFRWFPHFELVWSWDFTRNFFIEIRAHEFSLQGCGRLGSRRLPPSSHVQAVQLKACIFQCYIFLHLALINYSSLIEFQEQRRAPKGDYASCNRRARSLSKLTRAVNLKTGTQNPCSFRFGLPEIQIPKSRTMTANRKKKVLITDFHRVKGSSSIGQCLTRKTKSYSLEWRAFQTFKTDQNSASRLF